MTQILSAIETGDARAVSQLLPVVYDELRRLAAVHMALENPGHTLNATALVHEVYMRLVGADEQRNGSSPSFANRKHFFLVASESMRRILVDHARTKGRAKRGGGNQRVPLQDLAVTFSSPSELLAIDEMIDKFAENWPAVPNLLSFASLPAALLPSARTCWASHPPQQRTIGPTHEPGCGANG